MKNNNYKEKEKILNDTLDKLGTMSTRVSPMENDNSQLSSLAYILVPDCSGHQT